MPSEKDSAEIVNGQWPPNIELIDQHFQVKDKPNILYAFDGKIYNPQGLAIPEHIIVHEGVHLERQKMGTMTAIGWWMKYINDIAFRLNEESVAHKAEFSTFCKNFKDRNERARHLYFMASRLSGPLYGKMVELWEARRIITGGKYEI